jgi:gluconolactonase
MALDEAGGLLVAHPDMGAVWVFDHRGEPKQRVQSCRSDVVTNLCFKDRTIFITDSGAGAILTAQVRTPGVPLFSHS